MIIYRSPQFLLWLEELVIHHSYEACSVKNLLPTDLVFSYPIQYCGVLF
jgi:hypothetical protein